MGLTIKAKGLTHHNLESADVIVLLGESEGLKALKTNAKNVLKQAANNSLSQYDWYFVRQLRTGQAVPDTIVDHYKSVQSYIDDQETLIDTLDAKALEDYQFSVPLLV